MFPHGGFTLASSDYTRLVGYSKKLLTVKNALLQGLPDLRGQSVVCEKSIEKKIGLKENREAFFQEEKKKMKNSILYNPYDWAKIFSLFKFSQWR